VDISTLLLKKVKIVARGPEHEASVLLIAADASAKARYSIAQPPALISWQSCWRSWAFMHLPGAIGLRVGGLIQTLLANGDAG
jgi:hypothetical protein